ncbi:MAG: sterol desaturase family protein [Rhizobiales bacterium]|nr:sterol desaturase family protein [Hyphomicrobiales bacterium]
MLILLHLKLNHLIEEKKLEEAQIRLAVFIGLFVSMALLEHFSPRRKLRPVKVKRWFTNWAIILLDSLLVRLVFKTAAVGGALWASDNNIGLFNLVTLPYWLAFVVSFIILDFSVWLSHVASHKIPIFWRIHRMHHSDIDIDVTTAIRFHPIEILLSMLWKYAIVLLLGAPAASVLLFEIVLNGGALFNHSNWRMPKVVDRYLRLIIVTPDMHRVHHSSEQNETDSNYGFNFSFWDRLFKTYIDQPKLGHDKMQIGLKDWQDESPSRLLWSLLVPFKK